MYVGHNPTSSTWPAVASNILYGNDFNDADSLTGWTLPDTNRITDPRLGSGEGIDLWPRSNSPALDAAESGLPPGADFSGQPGPFDSNFDGVVAADVGALENRGEITGLLVASDPVGAVVLTWDGSINPAVTFNLYAEDGNPFASDGGFCLASGLAATTFTDGATLAPGQVRYYLVTGKGVVEGSRGFRSDGTPIPSSPSCPG